MLFRSSGVYADRKQAYFKPLDGLFPTRIVEVPNMVVERLLSAMDKGHKFFVSADIEVPPCLIPGIPIRSDYGTVYACGWGAGSYHSDLLKAEVEAGRLKIRRVNRCFWLADEKPLYRSLYERISAISYKPARKALYTRVWGLFASGDSWYGVKKPKDQEEAGKPARKAGSSLY